MNGSQCKDPTKIAIQMCVCVRAAERKAEEYHILSIGSQSWRCMQCYHVLSLRLQGKPCCQRCRCFCGAAWEQPPPGVSQWGVGWKLTVDWSRRTTADICRAFFAVWNQFINTTCVACCPISCTMLCLAGSSIIQFFQPLSVFVFPCLSKRSIEWFYTLLFEKSKLPNVVDSFFGVTDYYHSCWKAVNKNHQPC